MTRKFPGLMLLLFLGSAALAFGSDWAAHDYYIDPSSVDLVHILAPPPRPDTTAGKADLQAVLEAQRTRTAAETASAQADSQLTIFRFAAAIGPGFKSENLPFTTAFFERITSDQMQAVAAAKVYFKRPRPFVADTEVKPIGKPPANPSYPSGHATFAYVDAIILADMLPEKASAIFERADSYAHNRVVAGVHYPSDIEAGRISGSVIDNVLLHDAHFMADYDNARGELRHAVGLQ